MTPKMLDNNYRRWQAPEPAQPMPFIGDRLVWGGITYEVIDHAAILPRWRHEPASVTLTLLRLS